MAEKELSVKLTAKIADLKSQLKKAEDALKKTDAVAGKTGKSVGESVEKSFNKAGKGAVNAVPAVQEFSRVIQDAPYGIQGVANNIQQLTAQFGNLSAKTGGSSAAIKAMLASLTGPAGLLLAISLVTTLFVSASQSGLKLSDVLGFLSGDTDKLAAAKHRLAEASKEGISNAHAEIAVLDTLLEAARDETKSKKARQRAINKINDEYKDLLPNLSLENVNTRKVVEAVDMLSNSLIREAKIRGAQNLIAKETEKILDAQAKSAIDNASAWDITKAALLNYGTGSASAGAAVDIVSAGLKRQNKTIKESEERINSLKKSLTELIGEDLDFNGKFTSVKPLKAEKFKNLFKNLDDVFAIDKSIQSALDSASGTFKAVEVKFDKLGNAIISPLQKAGKQVAPALDKITAGLREFNAQAGEIIEFGIEDTFSGIGTAIGDSIANGTNVFESIGGALLDSIGKIAVQLGEAAIGIGVGMIAIKTAFKNPYTAIAAGVALVALGSAISGIANKATSGGDAGSSTVSGQGSTSSSSSVSSTSVSSSGFGSGKVVFEIRGTSLIGVLKNAQAENLRLGGNVSV